jgi:hypothetical protein
MASVFCLFIMDGCVYSLGRRHQRLARCHGAKITGLEKQMRGVDERLTTLALSVAQVTALESQVRGADERLTALASLLESASRSNLAPAADRSSAAAPAAAIRKEMTRFLAEFQEDEHRGGAEPPEPVQALSAE